MIVSREILHEALNYYPVVVEAVFKWSMKALSLGRTWGALE